MIPLFGGSEVETGGSTKAGSGQETKYEEVPSSSNALLLNSAFFSPPVPTRMAAHGNSTSMAAPWPTLIK